MQLTHGLLKFFIKFITCRYFLIWVHIPTFWYAIECPYFLDTFSGVSPLLLVNNMLQLWRKRQFMASMWPDAAQCAGVLPESEEYKWQHSTQHIALSRHSSQQGKCLKVIFMIHFVWKIWYSCNFYIASYYT